MFKKLIVLFLKFILLSSISANIEIKGRTAILQDFLSGEILYGKSPTDLFIQLR